MASTESEIRALLDRRGQAAWDKDISQLLAIYDPDIVYFDVVPPLRYTGAGALRERFTDWFTRWRSPIGQEIRDLHIAAGDQVAAADMLIRASGTLTDGREVDYWVRVSNAFRRSGDRWLITHEHVSLPVDLASGTVVMGLLP